MALERLHNWLTEPVAEMRLVSWLFLRLLALIYLAAFYSMTGQMVGLTGSEGILPIGELLDRLHAQHGAWAWLYFPTLFWIDASDWALTAAAWSGCVLSALLLLGIWPC